MKKYALIHDENICIGCQACSVACKNANEVPEGVFRLQVRMKMRGSFPSLALDMQRHSCVMCENPPCVDVCPTKASFIGSEGLVFVDNKLCVACGYCIIACPYEARFINPITKAADKCTFCYPNRTKPACVSVCPTEALYFGDISDTSSKVYQKASKEHLSYPLEHLKTKPKVSFVKNKRGVNHE